MDQPKFEVVPVANGFAIIDTQGNRQLVGCESPNVMKVVSEALNKLYPIKVEEKK